MKRVRESEKTQVIEDSNMDGLLEMTQSLNLNKSRTIPSRLCDLSIDSDAKKIVDKSISRSINSAPAKLSEQGTPGFYTNGTQISKEKKPSPKRFKKL